MDMFCIIAKGRTLFVSLARGFCQVLPARFRVRVGVGVGAGEYFSVEDITGVCSLNLVPLLYSQLHNGKNKKINKKLQR